MTHYDRLIDSIKQELWEFYGDIAVWDEQRANVAAQRILEHVEEFQTVRSLGKQWRASD